MKMAALPARDASTPRIMPCMCTRTAEYGIAGATVARSERCQHIDAEQVRVRSSGSSSSLPAPDVQVLAAMTQQRSCSNCATYVPREQASCATSSLT